MTKKLFIGIIAIMLLATFVLADEVVESRVAEVRVVSNDGISCSAWLQNNSQGEECAYAECFDGDTQVGQTEINCINTIPDYIPEELRTSGEPCQVIADNENPCVLLRCAQYTKSVCADQFSKAKIASKSCQTSMNLWFNVINFDPEMNIELQKDEVKTFTLNGQDYSFQVQSWNVGDKCPTRVLINSESVDIPAVSMVAQVPSVGLQILPVSVSYDYENEKYNAKFAIKSMAVEENTLVTLIQPNLTLWGKFLRLIGIIE
jgi:hypothetical protein